MKKIFTLFAALLMCGNALADEGMWLLQLMQEQNTIDLMKKRGLKLDALDVYNPHGASMKDAVGIFGGGCTGEIISPDGLILTNHHCGYESIQQHSSVEHDYLTDGFWAHTRAEELPTPGLAFTFVARIEDVTDSIDKKIQLGELTQLKAFDSYFLNAFGQTLLSASDLHGQKGISVKVLPFYAGNKFYAIYLKTYTDVRMVAAPPSSIGKFGDETDNWMWPRHTGDFSMFRIYADADGEPAAYSADNQPLRCQKFFPISLRGIEEGDYAMVMGFPGSTERYLTAAEVQVMMDSENAPRIRIRGARQEVLKAEMANSDKVRIQYATKYARSSNYWKNAIGMNKAIKDNHIIEEKLMQEQRFAQFADSQNNAEYQSVVSQIDAITGKTVSLNYQITNIIECFYLGTELRSPFMLMQQYVAAAKAKNIGQKDSLAQQLRAYYKKVHNKDYDAEVDRKVAHAIFPLYAQMVPAEQRISIYAYIDKKYKGNIGQFVDDCWTNSVFSNEKNLETFIRKPSEKTLQSDLATLFSASWYNKYSELMTAYEGLEQQLGALHKTYVRGLCEMKEPAPSYPDANFTLRLTYGTVQPYNPRDGVGYNYYTTLRGVMEKEDPTNREFVVPARLKELYQQGDFGRYAMKNGEMPVCFLTTNDITGGNSGSPVINGNGELIGAAFDGNWESLSGDIAFNDKLQRCICVDIRYVLFVLDKIGGCQNLLDEMTIRE